MSSGDLKGAKEEQNPWEASQNSPSWIKLVAGRPAPPGLPCLPRAAAGLDPSPSHRLSLTQPPGCVSPLRQVQGTHFAEFAPLIVSKMKNKKHLKNLSALAADMIHSQIQIFFKKNENFLSPM